MQLVLADGGILVGELVDLDRHRAALATDLWGVIEVPRKAARGLLAAAPPDLADRDRLSRRFDAAIDSADLLLLNNGDRLSGQHAHEQE